jgi:ferredoxin-NADP reductase
MSIAHEEQLLQLRVHQLTWEADGVISVHLRPPDGAALPVWQAGAHIDVRLPGVITRQYSLSGSPADRTTWRISVLREPQSKGGSQAVHESVRPGDLVEVVGPRNNFPLVEASEYLFIAGGIGITPILPMIEAAAAAGVPWQLMYGGRSRSSMAFLEHLAGHGDAVSIRPQDESGLLDLPSVLATPRPGVAVYCCGPEPLLTAVEQACATWPAGTLHLERFKPKEQAPVDPDAEQAFEVVLERSGTTVTVRPGLSVLEALEEYGIEPINSCREGFCGSCETKVLAGTPDHRDSLLSDDERAANDTMMICVGRALGDRLVLDL